MSEIIQVAATVVGITGSALLSGTIGTLSFVGVPALASAPLEIRPKIWKSMFEIGKASAPPLAITCAGCWTLLAYKSSNEPSRTSSGSSNSTWLYIAAALLVPAIVPFTVIFMRTTNARLIEIAKIAGEGPLPVGVGSEINGLLARWQNLNYVRAILTAGGAVMGAVGALQRS